MNIYLISGLGADRHAFDRLQLSSQHTLHFMDWIEPKHGESLSDYALRMSATIDSSKPFVFIGLSFGGILSIEIAKHISPIKIFLISSISCRKQLPWYARLAGVLQLDRLGLVNLLRYSDYLLFWAFGTKSPRMKAYLKERIAASSSHYLNWSIHQILNWKQAQKPEQVWHIHGSADRLFPVRYIQADDVLEGGSHFAVLTHAHKISAIINKHLDSL